MINAETRNSWNILEAVLSIYFVKPSSSNRFQEGQKETLKKMVKLSTGKQSFNTRESTCLKQNLAMC